VTLGGTIASAGPGAELQDFDCGEAIRSDDRLLASLDIDKNKMFFKTCT